MGIRDRESGAGIEITWVDTALVSIGSTGRGMPIEGTGGSGEEFLPGEGKCRSLHIAVYLTKARSVVLRRLGVM